MLQPSKPPLRATGDCTGARSLLRDLLVPGDGADTRDRNTLRYRLEYALVITFLYDQHYACNEYCKYFKNRDSPDYKFIPAVNRTYYDGSLEPRDGHRPHQHVH